LTISYTNINIRQNGIFLPKVAKEVGVVDYIVGEDCDIDAILPSIEKEVNEDTNIADTQK